MGILSNKFNAMRKVIILIGFISLFACSDKKNNQSATNGVQNCVDSKEDNLLGIINKTDTLKIFVEFSECGEWGGHSESIYLRRNEKNEILARLRIDSVSCDTDDVDKSRVVILEKQKILNDKDEQQIILFIKNLLGLYLRNNYLDRDENSLFIYKGSGTLLKVINTNSTFNLTFWNIDNYANTNYSKVRDQIFNEN